MTVNKYMLEHGHLVEILSAGHFPNSVMVKDLLNGKEYEVEWMTLELPPQAQLDNLERSLRYASDND